MRTSDNRHLRIMKRANFTLRALCSGVGWVGAALLFGLGLGQAAELACVSRWRPLTCGPVYEMAVSGSYAYVVAASELQVIDFYNPTIPVLVGRTSIAAGSSGVRIRGSYAYLLSH